MLAYLRRKAKEEGLNIETIQADMCDFRLKPKVDFAFIMMGSLCVACNDHFLRHLDSVACSLKKGGLYFIQNFVVDWRSDAEQCWTMEKDGIKVKTTLISRWKEIVSQIYTEKIVMEVDDHGKTCLREKRI